jgi:hypothetical protein
MANTNPPQSGQWFYIQSQFPDNNGNNQIVTVQGANTSPGAIIQLWTLQPNSYAGLPGNYNGLWQYDENGCIVSAIGNQKLVMDASLYKDPNTWVVLNTNSGSSSQQWTFNDDGTITNQSNNGLVLDIGDHIVQQGEWLEVDAAAQGSQTQQWSIVYPQVFAPKWVFIQSALTDNENNTYVATLEDGTSSVVLSPMQRNSSNQLWQITPDGRLLSATSGNPVVTLGSNYNWGPNGNYIAVGPSPANTDSSLRWVYNGNGQQMFLNASNGLALNVDGGAAYANAPLITYPAQSPTPADDIWTLSPAGPLDAIMAASPVPFPPFTGGEAAAYADINSQIGSQPYIPNFDVRSQYTNLAAPLSDWFSIVNDMPVGPCPNGVDPTAWPLDWQSVVKQLSAELTAADSIQKLFAQYSDFHTKIFADDGTMLNALITDAGMKVGDNKTNVGGIVLSVFEGVLYTALEAVPGATPIAQIASKTCAVLGNVMMGGINIGLSTANRGGGSISPDPFQVVVSDLWTQLSGNFEALLTTIGNMEDTILTDWGKMETTYRATLSTGPGSLAWADTLTPSLISAAKPGYTISVMQMLLPVSYQIFQYQANDDSALSGPDSNAQWIQSIGNNTWNKYWIATPGNWNEYPSDQAMEDVWNAGVARSDFFQGLAGWGFARCYPSKQGPSPGVDCNGLVITITNLTPNPLTVNASPSDGQGGVTVNGPSSQTLQPYGSVSSIGYYTSGPGIPNGLAIEITITDPNLAGSGPVASFTSHQNDCLAAGADVWVDPPPATSMGYQLTSPICYSGSFANSYPGTVQIGICLAPINDQSSS